MDGVLCYSRFDVFVEIACVYVLERWKKTKTGRKRVFIDLNRPVCRQAVTASDSTLVTSQV